MPARLRPRKWVLLGTCTAKCSLNEVAVGPDGAKMLHGWFEQGLNDRAIAKNAVSAGMPLSHGAVGRHRGNHLEPKGEIFSQPREKKRTDLEIIEEMIQAGGANAHTFKMTPTETMKAMELKYKFTQGSAFESMLDALNRAVDDDFVEDEEEEHTLDIPSVEMSQVSDMEADIAFEENEYSDDS